MPSNRPKPSRGPKAGAEPVRHQGSGLSAIQTRGTEQDGDKNSKQLLEFLDIQATGRTRVFPIHVNEALASKSGSDRNKTLERAQCRAQENLPVQGASQKGQLKASGLLPHGKEGPSGAYEVGGGLPCSDISACLHPSWVVGGLD